MVWEEEKKIHKDMVVRKRKYKLVVVDSGIETIYGIKKRVLNWFWVTLHEYSSGNKKKVEEDLRRLQQDERNKNFRKEYLKSRK